MFWLDKQAEGFVKQIIEWTNAWPAGMVEQKVKAITNALKTRADSLRKYLERFNNEHSRQELALIESYQGLGDPPPREVRIQKIWEDAVTHPATKFVIGFLDMVVLVEKTELEVDEVDLSVSRFRSEQIRGAPTWRTLRSPEQRFGFEAKVDIPSLGELIRQLRLYQQFRHHPLYVVSPDDRFAEQLVAQGFGFIKYPDGTIQKPPPTRRG